MKAFPKDITVETMVTRHIGVESELGVKGDHGAVIKACSKRGLLQSCGYDGGGREFRTNPISARSLKQVRGFKYLTEYYGILADNTTVLTSGGTHIHISILNSDHANLEGNVVAMAIAFHEQLQKISGRRNSWASRRMETTLQQVRNEVGLNKRRANGRAFRMGKYMLCPTYHQTFEFRGPKGSNDSEEILAWVEFLDNIVKACNRKSIEGVQFKQLLKGERISKYVDSLEGWRKLAKNQLEHKFDGSNLIKPAGSK
jgi:hypothetical protein